MNVFVTSDSVALVSKDDGNNFVGHLIPFDAIASYGVLLGLDNLSDIIQAIDSIRVQANANPLIDSSEVWTETINVLALGTPEVVEARAENQARTVTGNTEGNAATGHGQINPPGQLAKSQRSSEISAAQAKLRAYWKLLPPGQVKKDPALVALATTGLLADIDRRRAKYVKAITYPSVWDTPENE